MSLPEVTYLAEGGASRGGGRGRQCGGLVRWERAGLLGGLLIFFPPTFYGSAYEVARSAQQADGCRYRREDCELASLDYGF